MNLSSIAKKNCYYSLNCVGSATVDAFKIEFKSYYTSPSPFGIATVEEVDLPPLDGNTTQTDMSSGYSEKFQHVDAVYLDDSGAGSSYETPTLDKKKSSYWEFYEYDQTVVITPDNNMAKAGVIETSFETFVIALRTNWLSFIRC